MNKDVYIYIYIYIYIQQVCMKVDPQPCLSDQVYLNGAAWQHTYRYIHTYVRFRPYILTYIHTDRSRKFGQLVMYYVCALHVYVRCVMVT